VHRGLIAVFDFALTEDEMKAISALNKNERYNDPGKYTEPAFNNFYPIYE
jgi:D-xylose reductase